MTFYCNIAGPGREPHCVPWDLRGKLPYKGPRDRQSTLLLHLLINRLPAWGASIGLNLHPDLNVLTEYIRHQCCTHQSIYCINLENLTCAGAAGGPGVYEYGRSDLAIGSEACKCSNVLNNTDVSRLHSRISASIAGSDFRMSHIAIDHLYATARSTMKAELQLGKHSHEMTEILTWEHMHVNQY